jgi:hypothetical protein
MIPREALDIDISSYTITKLSRLRSSSPVPQDNNGSSNVWLYYDYYSNCSSNRDLICILSFSFFGPVQVFWFQMNVWRDYKFLES